MNLKYKCIRLRTLIKLNFRKKVFKSTFIYAYTNKVYRQREFDIKHSSNLTLAYRISSS